MNNTIFFHSEEIGAHWGMVPIGKRIGAPIQNRARHEPEVLQAIARKARPPFQPGLLGRIIDKLV